MAAVRDYVMAIRRFSPAARVFLLASVLAGQGKAVAWILMNLYLQKCGWDETRIGWARSAGALGTLLLAVPLVLSSDRRRLKPFLVFGAAAVAFGVAAMTLRTDVPSILTLSFLANGGASILMISAAPFFMRASTPEERPFLFAIGMAVVPFSMFVGGLLIRALAGAWGDGVDAYSRMMIAGAGVTTLAVAAFALLLREPPPEPRAADGGAPLPVPLALRLCLPGFVTGLGAGLTIPFINLYFHNRFRMEAGPIGFWFASAEAVAVLGFLAAPVFARRLGMVRTVIACQLASIPFFLAMAFTMNVGVALAAFLARNALMNMAGPVESNFAMELVPAGHRARLSGLKGMSWNVAWVASNALGGWMIQHMPTRPDGFVAVMLVTIGLYVASSTLYWAFFGKMRVGAGAATPAALPAE